MYQAYEQDDNHNVVSINAARLQEVVTLADAVIGSGKYGLFDNFGKNFAFDYNNVRYDNGIGSIFAIQFSINDGPTWDQAFAREALRFERRLEFAMESPRFFDLVRWGIAAETLNAYIEVEKTRHSYLSAAHFRKNQDDYLPIPISEIALSENLYVQNTGTW